MSETQPKVLNKEDVDYLAEAATDAPADTVDAVRSIVRMEAGVDNETTHIEVVDKSGERYKVHVNSIGSVSLKNAMAEHSGSWQTPENK